MEKVKKIYLIDKPHRHNSVKNVNDYLHIKIINKDNNFKVQYCDICRKYMCPIDRYEKIYKNKYDENLFSLATDNTFIKDTSFKSDLNNMCLNLKTNFFKEHLNHNICEKIIKYKNSNISLAYCKDCDTYGIDEEYYNEIRYGHKANDIILDKIELLIKINSFKCIAKKHKIEEVTAIVNVFNKNNELDYVEITAFYCTYCKLYYIYDSEYQKLLKKGIPLCPVYEENKYFEDSKTFYNFKAESLLRQFGYNVNSQDDLSYIERQNILMLVLTNGIMTKNEILSHLSFLVNSRKNIKNMANAISKWNQDIEFVNNIKHSNKKIKVGAFRKVVNNQINKNN